MIFQEKIKNWYQINKRNLPWRNTTDPYKVWISEIILQQTQVSQGLPYYYRFVSEFPTVTELANADEDHILKLWQGLGYYSRARNLHYSAKVIRDKYNSNFPSDYYHIKKLKGVGDYTAAAISSFCFKLPYAVLDGNVYRLLSRYFGIDAPIDTSTGKKKFVEISQELICVKEPDIYNQAIMEFGSLQCRPKNPNCAKCILKSTCYSYETELVSLLPIKSKLLKIVDKYFNFIIFISGSHTFIHKRKNGIWKSLYQFPLIEGEFSFDELKSQREWRDLINNKEINLKYSSSTITHKLTHQRIHAIFHHVEIEDLYSKEYMRVNLSELQNYPTPRLIEKYIQGLDH